MHLETENQNTEKVLFNINFVIISYVYFYY
jgi:hypothetical protein